MGRKPRMPKPDADDGGDDFKEVQDNNVHVALEVWLVKDQKRLRVYAARPNSAKVAYKPGLLEGTVQAVVKGMVNAWEPVWRAWATREDVFRRLQYLLDHGWSLDPKKAVVVMSEFLAWQQAQPPRLQPVVVEKAVVATAAPVKPVERPHVDLGMVTWQAVPLFPVEDVG